MKISSHARLFFSRLKLPLAPSQDKLHNDYLENKALMDRIHAQVSDYLSDRRNPKPSTLNPKLMDRIHVRVFDYL